MRAAVFDASLPRRPPGRIGCRPARVAGLRAAALLAAALVCVSGCVELTTGFGAPPAATAPADTDAARRASELETPARPSVRDRARAARLTRDGRARYARRPSADLVGAARALGEAAKLGDTSAQLLLAQNEQLRPEGERDQAGALLWLTRAAVRGNAVAQFQLAQAYASGQRVRREPSWADVWYERAARQGYRESMQALGQRRASGAGLDTDELEAYRWLTLAVRNGLKPLERDRAAAAKLLSAEERAALDAEIAAWKPIQAEPSPDMALTRFVQAELVANGFDAGPADGRLGARTLRALVAYKRTLGDASPSEEITPAVVMSLRGAAAVRATP